MRRVVLTSIGIAAVAAAVSAWAGGPSGDAPAREAPGPTTTAATVADVARLLRFEPTGLSLLQPYRRGRVPVVFVHGLWSTPCSWARMVEALEADPDLRDRYQFWTYGYSTGDPILYSASLMRAELDQARRALDPDRSDAALDRTVVVGHSMGGLLAKIMVQDSGRRLWRVVSQRPFEDLAGEPEDRDVIRRALIFEPRPEVRRVVFIATPHRGSRVDRGRLEHLGSRLVRHPEPLRASYARLMARNGPEFFTERLRKGLPTSLDELEWGSPVLAVMLELGLASGVKAHSVIADRHNPPGPGGGDGLVSYDSAHLDGVASETLVSAGHLCQDNPAVIREVRRILAEHAGPP